VQKARSSIHCATKSYPTRTYPEGVNNEPAATPPGLEGVRGRLLCLFAGHDPACTPHGLHKFEWDPTRRRFDQAWVCTTVSSPNSVPLVSPASDLVYTCGARDRKWTIKPIDWSNGAPAFRYVVGGSQFNILGGGVTIDDEGRLLYSTIFGETRLLRTAG